MSGVVQPNGTRLTTTVAADDVRGLLQSIVAGTSLRGFFSPPLEMPAMPEEMSPYAAQRPANSGFVFSPADAMSNELAGRLVACANGTPAPAATASSFSVTQLLDALVTIAPADCTTTTAQWSTAASPVASQESLLQALGVQQLLNSLIGGPAVACASRTPSDSASTTSFMDAIGVPGLLNELLGD
ncbi:hypothetical protein [Nonomuraea sp. NPDC050643]|uniref:hypothetical protein n=1 Tax=Nonomuraea sp. NPDC050643 TaxID=3155660 RepID=UPI0033DB0511